MGLPFPLFVAQRYLRAKRKQAAISLVTAISVIGVAAGVMALVVALAINNGFRSTLQRSLLGATAHVMVLEKETGYGIENWRDVTARLRKLPHVTAASPTLYGSLLFKGPIRATGGILKGVPLGSGEAVPEMLRTLKQGSLSQLERPGGLPGIILGSKLAQETGMVLNAQVTVISPEGELTPFGPRVKLQRFRVVGLFESGFYDLDAAWAYTTLAAAQDMLGLADVVNAVELKVDDIDLAPEIARAAEQAAGKNLAATHWQEQNRPVLNALRMERVVTVITIGLIQLVAALNILIALVMMVMEKQRDIAILSAMGARREQVRAIFMMQGVLIGAVGTVLGLIAGYTICHFADRYRWIELDAAVYALAYVPFQPRWPDALWISAVALAVSFVATIYPARSATKIAPVETLRYE